MRRFDWLLSGFGKSIPTIEVVSSFLHPLRREVGLRRTVQPVGEPIGAVGICRRWPPRMTRSHSGHIAALFPNVHRAHVCGEVEGAILC
ncbi:hypothetical protein U1701_03490 [Sphingomonas sp. PB2P19]|uniref:hypothetical protein n=1 Tax=Sphingomonas rhamnosi TaxID=3096156 RepID=UPI002FC92038